MIRLVADIGNTRIKWGRLGPDGALVATLALSLDEPDTWSRSMEAWGLGAGIASTWAIASVNPPVADRFVALLRHVGYTAIHLYRSADEVLVPHALATPRTTGADRALAVLAALGRHPEGGPGQVISCGTAITVERIGADGVWQGGAIAPGLGPSAHALNRTTAQLPRIAIDSVPPAAWGDATEPALAAGIFWGVVGATRELLARQAEGFDRLPWRIWTGGDAPVLARLAADSEALVVPDLVLEGLARSGFGDFDGHGSEPGHR